MKLFVVPSVLKLMCLFYNNIYNNVVKKSVQVLKRYKLQDFLRTAHNLKN